MPLVPGPDHVDNEFHHHHSHAIESRHPGHHHLLQVEGLSASFIGTGASGTQDVDVLKSLTLSVHAGEVLALVGASGSGKSVLADALLGLFAPNERVSGSIWFDGRPMDARSLASARGRDICLVPQNAAALDPLMRVGDQVVGVAKGTTRSERMQDLERRRARARGLFSRYGLDRRVWHMLPHELSGGMARRVLLMCALMEEPRLLIADEPTPGLDACLAGLASEDLRGFARSGGAVLMITHDLSLALEAADRVAVFRDGAVVEETSAENFSAPELLREEYTRALWYAMPSHGMGEVPHGA